MKPFDDSDSSPEAGDKREFHALQRELEALKLVRTSTPKIEGSVFIKMSVVAVVMMAFVAVVSIKVMFKTQGENAKIDPFLATVVMSSSAAVGASIGGLLALKDRVQRKLEKGEPVSQFLRLLFGSKEASLAIWISLIFFICLIVVPVLLSLRPF